MARKRKAGEALNRRLEVLFGEKEYHRLEEIAYEKKQSVGSLVREAVAEYVAAPDRFERRRALHDLLSLDGGPVGSPEELKEELLRGMDEDLDQSLSY